jgi:hypothetical protein
MKCHEIANPLFFFLLVLRVGTNYSITVINKTVTSRSIGYCICIAYYLLFIYFLKMLKMKCHEIANPLFFLLVLRVGTNYSITVINKTVTSRFIGYCICIAYYYYYYYYYYYF